MVNMPVSLSLFGFRHTCKTADAMDCGSRLLQCKPDIADMKNVQEHATSFDGECDHVFRFLCPFLTHDFRKLKKPKFAD